MDEFIHGFHFKYPSSGGRDSRRKSSEVSSPTTSPRHHHHHHKKDKSSKKRPNSVSITSGLVPNFTNLFNSSLGSSSKDTNNHSSTTTSPKELSQSSPSVSFIEPTPAPVSPSIPHSSSLQSPSLFPSPLVVPRTASVPVPRTTSVPISFQKQIVLHSEVSPISRSTPIKEAEPQDNFSPTSTPPTSNRARSSSNGSHLHSTTLEKACREGDIESILALLGRTDPIYLELYHQQPPFDSGKFREIEVEDYPTEGVDDNEYTKWVQRRRHCMRPWGSDGDIPFALLIRKQSRGMIATFIAALDVPLRREMLLWRNRKKWNVLHEAAQRSDLNILCLIVQQMNALEIKIPLEEENDDGKTPIELTGDIHCLALLLHCGAKPRIGHKFLGEPRGLSLLLRHGADPIDVINASSDQAKQNRQFAQLLDATVSGVQSLKTKTGVDSLKVLYQWSKSPLLAEQRMAASSLCVLKDSNFASSKKSGIILGQIITQLLRNQPREIQTLIHVYEFLGELNSFDNLPVSEILKLTKPAVGHLVDPELHCNICKFLLRTSEISPPPDFPLTLATAIVNLINGKTILDETKLQYLVPLVKLTKQPDTATKFTYVGAIDIVLRLTLKYRNEKWGQIGSQLVANLIREETGYMFLKKNRCSVLSAMVEACDIKHQFWELCAAFVSLIIRSESILPALSDREKDSFKSRVLEVGGLRVLQDLATRNWPEGEKESWKYVVHKTIDQSLVTIKWPTSDGSVKPLGQGASGAVYAGTFVGRAVAVKEIMHNRDFSPQMLRREITMLSMLNHPHIARFYGAYVNNGKYYLVTELAPYGSLKQLLHTQKLNDFQKMKLALGIAKGLAYLHSLGVCHRDLKAANVLVFEDHEAKLIDFGLTRVASPHDLTNVGGTFNYMPPEVFSLALDVKAGTYTQSNVLPASDVYSFGYLLWELETGKDAYPPSVAVVIERKKKQLKSKSLPLSISPNSFWKGLIEQCWQFNPEDRPVMDQIVHNLEELTHISLAPTTKKVDFKKT